MSIRLLVPVSALTLFAAGCGNRNGTVPVEGTVTLDGQPVARASIVFHAQGGAGRPAVGSTEVDGRFTLTTTQFGDGATPGKYKVVVTKYSGPLPVSGLPPPPPKTHGEPKAGQLPIAPGQMAQAARQLAQRKNELPAIYASAKTTSLEIEVPKKGTKDLQITLDSKQTAQKK